MSSCEGTAEAFLQTASLLGGDVAQPHVPCHLFRLHLRALEDAECEGGEL